MPKALVLGAGIMGLSSARALSRQGWDVTVLDQDEWPNPRGASVDDHRLIRHAYGSQTGYMRMVDAAYGAWETLWEELGERLYVPTGVLALGETGAGWLAESRASLGADGHAMTRLDAAGIEARFPMLSGQGVGDAFLMASGGVLLARRIVAALAAHLAGRGVVFRRARVADVLPERAGLRLDDGTLLTADRLVVAAGPWLPRLLPALAPRVTASRQVVVYLAPPPAQEAGWAAAPMLLDLAEQGGFYAVPPVAGTALKIGDHRFSLRGDAEADSRDPSADEIEAILALARPRLVAAGAYRVLGARACYYDVAEGERFIIEPLGEACTVMSGFSGHGFKFGPLLGEAVAARSGEDLRLWAAGEDRSLSRPTAAA